MVGQGPATQYTLEETFDIFQQLEPPGMPLSTGEVAAKLGCDRDVAVENLEALGADGLLETREVDGSDRIWWRRRGHSQDVGQDAQPGLDQAQFHELVRAVADYAIFVLDTEGRVQTWNEGARQIKGYRKDEIVGEHFSTFYTEADREAGRPERNLEMAAQQGRIEDEGERVRKDGSTFWANVTITSLRDDDGDLQGYMKITRDMTERHEYEERLRQEKERFETLVREVKDYAIFLLDAEGRVQTWNEGAKELKGYRKDEIVGEHFSAFYTEADREAGRPEENLRKAIEDGRVETEGKRVRKDGSTFWANVIITALHDDDGEIRGFAKVTRDMTERHQYEQTIEDERERLEFMNRIVRHNVLNGLNLVNARTEVLQSRLPDDHEGQEHIGTILTRIDDLASLIETMREFMDVVVSETDHDIEPVAIRRELESKLTLARESYPDAIFESSGLPDPSTMVMADELIGEMFENVLSNAVIHNDKETPHIEVWSSETTHEAPLDSETGEFLPDQRTDVHGDDVVVRECPAVAIHIADNGPGIPDEKKEEILEKGVSGLRAPGNGFGLYLVNEMMDAYGGSVNVRDRNLGEDGDGVVFELVFHRVEDGTPA